MNPTASGASGAAPSESRYQRVKRILNEAQGSADPSYQGYHRFWELPLAEFLTLTLYGVRMIAPAMNSSAAAPMSSSDAPAMSGSAGCCHCPPANDGGKSPGDSSPARSASSGLIIGLKGQAPFDGTQFPPLPWGGQPVSAADIAFIAQWIDDGCPAEDTSRSLASVHEASLRARINGMEAHPRSLKPLNTHRAEAGALKTRKNVACLRPDELARLCCALQCMHRYDNFYQDERSYAYWARIHANNCQHGWEEFLTWHRIYLYLFEQRLQDIDTSVTLPYWDWTLYDQDWNTLGVDTGTIPTAYQCVVTDAVLAELKGKIPAATLAQLTAIKDQPFNSGPRLFKGAKIPYPGDKASDEAIIAALQNANPLWHRFRWPGGDATIIFENYPRPQDIENILAIDSFFPFGSGSTDDHFFGALENVHNLLHNFSGGINPNYDPNANPPDPLQPQTGSMVSAGVTAFDPIFWGHHSNVDRLWDAWQQRHPGVGPDNPDAVLPPFAFNVSDSYSIRKLGYEYLLDSSVFETDPTTPITRFKSAPAAIHPAALERYRRAEVRLENVRHSVDAAGYLRIFINEPDADASTPTRGNDHYVGQFSVSLTGCIGGPGHCAPAPKTTRRFDLRERHRKTPGNVRLDATDTLKKLQAQGATDFHVHVVALGLDGKPNSDLLRLEAVSLNLFQ